MKTKDRMASVEPVRLGPESTFKFKCHPGVACFTECCRDINIILTPYDIIRLKNRLDLSSEEFLALYTEPQLLEKTGLPVVTLKFLDQEGKDTESKTCPFVRENGCLVAEWTDLVVRKRSFPPNVQLTDQTKQMFFMVSYNLDKFREFVFGSTFLQRYEVDAAILEEIKNDELALLKFGLKWLKWLLFKEGDFKIKPGAETT